MKHIRLKTLQNLGLLFSCIITVSAHSPASPYRHVVSNESKFFFVMQPASYKKQNGDLVESKPARGAVFKSRSNGSFKKIWSVQGWYEFPGNVLLSPDGKTVVRIREQFLLPDGTFSDDHSKDILSIYRKGKYIAGYTAKDLITNFKQGILFDGVSGLKWVDRCSEFGPRIEPSRWHSIDQVTEGEITISTHPHVLQLTTLEGTSFLFELHGGTILRKRPLKNTQPEKSNDQDPFIRPHHGS